MSSMRRHAPLRNRHANAEAAKRFEIVVVLSQMMSNHHHGVVYDAHGREVELREHFHEMMAKSQNALRGRWEKSEAMSESIIRSALAKSRRCD